MAKSETDAVHIINSMVIARLSHDELQAHLGEYAVLVDGKIESYHVTNREALASASGKYRYGQFSVQRVEPQPIDMGFTDCASYPR